MSKTWNGFIEFSTTKHLIPKKTRTRRKITNSRRERKTLGGKKKSHACQNPITQYSVLDPSEEDKSTPSEFHVYVIPGGE